jgi:hypothetical protein
MRHTPELLDQDELRAEPVMSDAGLFGDIPRSIWIAFLSAWALLFGLFLIFFTKDGPASLAVVTASFFALMLLGLPAALGAQANPSTRERPRMVITHNGPLPVRAAATQILLIPVGAVIGVTLFIILGM